jgi:DNA-binding transcriptional LysR family regulator
LRHNLKYGNYLLAVDRIVYVAEVRNLVLVDAKARVFDRDTRRLTITPAGQELLHIARRVLVDFDSALSELGHFMKGYRGQVSVAALPSINVALLPSAIAKFRQQHP